MAILTVQQAEDGVGRLRVATPAGEGILKGLYNGTDCHLVTVALAGGDAMYPIDEVAVVGPRPSEGRTFRLGPVRVDLNPARLGRPQFSRGPGWMAVSWGNGWDNPVWVIEVSW